MAIRAAKLKSETNNTTVLKEPPPFLQFLQSTQIKCLLKYMKKSFCICLEIVKSLVLRNDSVCVDTFNPSQQALSHVGIISCLPGLNQF